MIEVFQKQKARDDEIQAWCILARAMPAQDKAAAASDAIAAAASPSLEKTMPSMLPG